MPAANKLCVAVAPACTARAEQIRANLRDFDRHLQTRPHASALFLFSMHPLRGIETVHWQMHSLECDQTAFAQKVAAAEEKSEAEAGAAAAQSASGKKNATGKRRQQDKARPALARTRTAEGSARCGRVARAASHSSARRPA